MQVYGYTHPFFPQHKGKEENLKGNKACILFLILKSPCLCGKTLEKAKTFRAGPALSAQCGFLFYCSLQPAARQSQGG